MEPTLSEITETIRQKRIRLGHPTEYIPKQRKIARFGSDTEYLLGMYGVLPYRVK